LDDEEGICMSKNNIKLLYVSAEIAPYATTGGLGDVSESLPDELSAMGTEVVRIMPKYMGIEEDYPLQKTLHYMIEVEGRIESAELYVYKEDRLTTYFIGNKLFFDREQLYGYDDDGMRFGFFSKAVLQLLPIIGFKPDIIHVNDWHGGLIPFLLKTTYGHNTYYKEMKVFYTIHNLQYQGIFQIDLLDRLNISRNYFHNEALEFYGNVSFMKAGIIFSDTVSTVSHTYAEEIQTPAYGYGLDGILRRHKLKLIGIINGVHYEKFNPETDPYLAYTFGTKNAMAMKGKNKLKLQQEVGLPQRQVPLVSMISRLSDQKGIDIAIGAMEAIVKEDQEVQFLILGTGKEDYEDSLRNLEKVYPDQIKVIIAFDHKLARKIYGASDYFMMPSRFEPCGLSQLYSMRFGTIPIVRKTGGLVDTVEPFDGDTVTGCGFVFESYDETSLRGAIKDAIDIYHHKKKRQELVRHCMEKRFSWEGSAKTYIDEYKKLIHND